MIPVQSGLEIGCVVCVFCGLFCCCWLFVFKSNLWLLTAFLARGKGSSKLTAFPPPASQSWAMQKKKSQANHLPQTSAKISKGEQQVSLPFKWELSIATGLGFASQGGKTDVGIRGMQSAALQKPTCWGHQAVLGMLFPVAVKDIWKSCYVKDQNNPHYIPITATSALFASSC